MSDNALRLDPTSTSFRSCSFVFLQTGDASRVEDFIKYDRNSAWARNMRGAVPETPPKFSKPLRIIDNERRYC